MARSAIHPGEHLAEELDALKMSAAHLARRLKVPTNRVTEILHGQRAIMSYGWPRPRLVRPSRNCRPSNISKRPTPERTAVGALRTRHFSLCARHPRLIVRHV